MLKKWEEIPAFMRISEVRPYWDVLNKKRGQLLIKRTFDICFALFLLLILGIPMIIIAIMIKADSKGPVFYRQERVTAYGKVFRIHKFRTMVDHADQIGTSVTVNEDNRITRVGKRIRNLRFDEFPQLLDVLTGDMTFVGTRPEAVKYVDEYKPEYYATLLLPAGITNEASIRFKDEAKLLELSGNVDHDYLNIVLPQKMKWNLSGILHFSLRKDLYILIKTVFAVVGD